MRIDLAQLVERLDDENIKSLQETDSHSLEYVKRLRSEVLIYNLIVMTEKCVSSPLRARPVQLLRHSRTLSGISPKWMIKNPCVG